MFFIGSQLVIGAIYALPIVSAEIFFLWVFIKIISIGNEPKPKPKKNEIKFDTDNYPFGSGEIVHHYKLD